MDAQDAQDYRRLIHWVLTIVGIAVLLVVLGMWGCPQYSVYERRLTGESELRRAEWNRQITVQEGKARFEAAAYLAAAETTRAHGVARANAIIGASLAGPSGEAYLRYLWIHTLNDSTKQVIYVPTEAGLPILEAGRRPPLR